MTRTSRRKPDDPLSRLLAICEALGDAALGGESAREAGGGLDAEELAREVVVVAFRMLVEASGGRDDGGWLWSDEATPSWAGGLGVYARTDARYRDAEDLVRELADGAAAGSEGGFAELAVLYERVLDVRAEFVDDQRCLNWVEGATRRRRSGAFYTPTSVVEHLLDLALEPTLDAWLDGGRGDPAERLLAFRICDPACGTGRFLVAAQRRLGARLSSITGRSERQSLRLITESCLFGVDVDSCAAALCRASLALSYGGASEVLDGQIRTGNALVGLWPRSRRGVIESSHEARSWLEAHGVRAPSSGACIHWPLDFSAEFDRNAPGGGGFHAVLGNPPFLNQLARDTALDRGSASVLREVSDGAIRGYADMASAFLLLAARLCREDGRVAMLQPLSVLAAAGAEPVRASVMENASIEAIWVADGRSFEDTGVPVCAPVLARQSARDPLIRRTRGLSFEVAPPVERDEVAGPHAASWAALAAFDVPRVPPALLDSGVGTIGDLAECTADFRDEYYRLRGAIREAADDGCADADSHRRLITSGLIDLAECKWGRTTTQILKQRWAAPTVDERAIKANPDLEQWIVRRAVPKVLLATQTRVLEVIVDPGGHMLPVTPVVSIVPSDPDNLWRIAAALASPVATVIAMRRHGGAALSPSAIKLSARQVAALPLPADRRAWSIAADEFKRAQEAAGDQRANSLRRYGHAALVAYGLSGEMADEIFGYWKDRAARGAHGG